MTRGERDLARRLSEAQQLAAQMDYRWRKAKHDVEQLEAHLTHASVEIAVLWSMIRCVCAKNPHVPACPRAIVAYEVLKARRALEPR